MKKISVLVVLVVCAMALLGRQNESWPKLTKNEKRWLEVDSWQGTVTVRIRSKENRRSPNMEWNTIKNVTVKSTVRMERMEDAFDEYSGTWRTETVESTVDFDLVNEQIFLDRSGNKIASIRLRYHGANGEGEGGILDIAPGEKKYNISLPHARVEVKGEVDAEIPTPDELNNPITQGIYRLAERTKKDIEASVEERGFRSIDGPSLSNLDLPGGYSLRGNWTSRSGEVEADWRFSPGGRSSLMSLEKCPAEFWPNPDPRQRNAVEIKVKGDGFFGEPVKVRFTLTETSNEKGAYMNSHVDDMDPDLDFDYPENEGRFDVDDQGAYVTKQKVKNTSIHVATRDFGAYGKLTAEALIDEESQLWIQIYPEDSPLDYITIPLDEKGGENHIADSWEERMNDGDVGADPTEDMDTYPETGHFGDGISLYEEYRGFSVQGDHIRLDPNKRDLFICCDDFVLFEGIRRFEELTGLKVHRIYEWEFVDKETRVINPNRNEDLSHVEQHGLYLVDRMYEDEDGNIRIGVALQTEEGKKYGKPGQPGHNPENPGKSESLGTPGTIKEVRVDAALILYSGWDVWLIVIHELLHACSVEHHGIYDSYNFDDCCTYGFISSSDCLGEDVNGRIAIYGGRHSGDVNCVMSYFSANYYTTDDKTLARWEDGTPRLFINTYYYQIPPFICRSPEGTGPNRGGEQTGHASRGDCWHQIRICDAGH